MHVAIPELDQFSVHALGQAALVENQTAEVSFTVEIKPGRVTRRVVVGILDETRQRGIAVAIYPATGEVCDLSNDGGVIGYLEQAPLATGVAVPCDLTLYRFGKNIVCGVRIQGEAFLYPAFSMPSSARLTAFVGQEEASGAEAVGWSHLHLEVSAPLVAA